MQRSVKAQQRKAGVKASTQASTKKSTQKVAKRKMTTTNKKKQQQKNKKLKVTQKRSFGSVAVDPRFSKINANLDRMEQAKLYPLCSTTQLYNGLRVSSESQAGDMVSIAVGIDAGSRYENENNNGTAHFLEHILFKGTKRRSRTDLEMQLENMGGSLNAFTSREQTVFTATVQKKNVKDAVELLSDVFHNSNLSDRDIDNEREVIIEEMESVAQDMQETVYDYMHKSAYRHSSLAYDILGPLKNIQKIDSKDLRQYIQTHYTGPRMTVSAVGDVDHADFHNLVEKHFSTIPHSPINGIAPVKTPAHFIGSDLRIRDDDMPRTHVAIGFETAGWNDSRHYPLMALQMMLGSHNSENSIVDQYSSSEFISGVATYGWANSVTPFNTLYSDTGIFGLYAVAGCNTLDKLGNAMVRSLVVHSSSVPEQTLREAKAKLQFSLLSQYEGTEGTVEELTRQILSHGRRIHPVEIIARVNDVDQMAVQNVVNDFFVDQDFVVAAMGNTFEMPDYPVLRKQAMLPWM